MEKKVTKKAEQERKANVGDGINKRIIDTGRVTNQKMLTKKKRSPAW